MLSSTVSETLQRFLDSRNSHQPLTRFVEELVTRYEQMLAHLPKYAENASQWPNVSSEVHQVIAHVPSAMRGNPSSAIFKAVDHVHADLSQVPRMIQTERLSESLTHFAHTLDAFIESPAPAAGLTLLQAAHSLKESYNALAEMAASVIQLLEPEPVGGGGRLVIAIDDDLSLDEMASFLTAFAAIYRRLAEIAQLAQAERELQVRKVESGSWYMDLLGNAALMTLLGSLVTAFFTWSYRRYTHEGRAKSLPEKMESVQKALNLREKLKDAGYQVEHLDNSIQGLERDVARELVELFEPRRRVRVDNAVYTRIEPVWPDGMEVTKLISPPPSSLALPHDDKGNGKV